MGYGPMCGNGGWPERLWVVRHAESEGKAARAVALAAGAQTIALPTRDPDIPRYGVAPSPALDFPALFGNTAPVVLEIGFGMGETTAAIAAAHPGLNFFGVEMHWPGIGALLRRIDAQAAACGEIRGDRLAQLDDPGGRGVVRLASLERGHSGGHDGRRRVEIGFADLEVDDVASVRLERAGAGEDLECGLGPEA